MKNVINCIVSLSALFFLNNAFAALDTPNTCPSLDQIKSKTYVLRDTGVDTYDVREDSDRDCFGGKFLWHIQLDIPIDAKSLYEAECQFYQLLSEITSPIFLKNSCNTTCWYRTNNLGPVLKVRFMNDYPNTCAL